MFRTAIQVLIHMPTLGTGTMSFGNALLVIFYWKNLATKFRNSTIGWSTSTLLVSMFDKMARLPWTIISWHIFPGQTLVILQVVVARLQYMNGWDQSAVTRRVFSGMSYSP